MNANQRLMPVNVMGGPMREYAPGKWENAIWPSDMPPAQASGAVTELVADMFWDNDNAERCEHSIIEVVSQRVDDGAPVGEEFEIQRAVRLSNVKVRIIEIPATEDSDADYDYEIISGPLAQWAAKQPSAAVTVPAAAQASRPIGGVMYEGDWFINFGTHVRVTNAEFARGWNEARALAQGGGNER